MSKGNIDQLLSNDSIKAIRASLDLDYAKRKVQSLTVGGQPDLLTAISSINMLEADFHNYETDYRHDEDLSVKDKDEQAAKDQLVILNLQKSEQLQQKFRHDNHKLLSQALAPGHYNLFRFNIVAKLLDNDVKYAITSGLGHSSIKNEDLMCIYSKSCNSEISQLIKKEPDKYANESKVIESADLVRQYYEIKYLQSITPEEAAQISTNDHKLVAEAEEFYRQRSDETGHHLQRDFHLKNYPEGLTSADRKIIWEINHDPDKCRNPNSKAKTCSLKDHENEIKYASVIKQYQDWFVATYPDNPKPWKDPEYDSQGNRIGAEPSITPIANAVPPQPTTLKMSDGLMGFSNHLSETLSKKIAAPLPEQLTMTKVDPNGNLEIFIPNNHTPEKASEIIKTIESHLAQSPATSQQSPIRAQVDSDGLKAIISKNADPAQATQVLDAALADYNANQKTSISATELTKLNIPPAQTAAITK